jgi:hypothetical protein
MGMRMGDTRVAASDIPLHPDGASAPDAAAADVPTGAGAEGAGGGGGAQGTVRGVAGLLDRRILSVVVGGDGRVLASDEEGAVYAWGPNHRGQCGFLRTSRKALRALGARGAVRSRARSGSGLGTGSHMAWGERIKRDLRIEGAKVQGGGHAQALADETGLGLGLGAGSGSGSGAGLEDGMTDEHPVESPTAVGGVGDDALQRCGQVEPGRGGSANSRGKVGAVVAAAARTLAATEPAALIMVPGVVPRLPRPVTAMAAGQHHALVITRQDLVS